VETKHNVITDAVSKRSRTAFSLIEVVVALAIFAFAFIAIIGVLPIGLSAARSVTNFTLQAQLIKQVVSTLQETPFAEVAVSSGFTTNFTRQGDPATTSSPAYYTVTSTVVPPGNTAALLPSTPPTSTTNIALIQIIVTTADHTTNYYSTVIANLGSQ
jgi:uncharacterized protein (TIGR02598 family)